MKVYEIRADAKPSVGRFQSYASLVVSPREDRRFLILDDFAGVPFNRDWKKLRLFITEPKLPKPDFFNFGVGIFVCNEKAVELTGEVLEAAGELLPVSIDGQVGEYYVFNATHCIDVLDRKKSILEGLRCDRKFSFRVNGFGDISLFKIPEDFGLGMYCFERSGDPDDGEFKALVESNKLTGLSFYEIWSKPART